MKSGRSDDQARTFFRVIAHQGWPCGGRTSERSFTAVREVADRWGDSVPDPRVAAGDPAVPGGGVRRHHKIVSSTMGGSVRRRVGCVWNARSTSGRFLPVLELTAAGPGSPLRRGRRGAHPLRGDDHMRLGGELPSAAVRDLVSHLLVIGPLSVAELLGWRPGCDAARESSTMLGHMAEDSRRGNLPPPTTSKRSSHSHMFARSYPAEPVDNAGASTDSCAVVFE
jgi:hypothetical protein